MIPTFPVAYEPVDSGLCACGGPATHLVIVDGKADGSMVCAPGSRCAAQALARFDLRNAVPYGAA